MTGSNTHRYVFRGTIEFTTPFLIGAGREDDVADLTFVSDSNGLPALPGTSLTGVLRALYTETYGDAEAAELFGFQKRDEGAGSRLVVSWGCLCDSENRPVEGIVDAARLADPVLREAREAHVRDHVRITHRGAADAAGYGKFDERALSAGHRFVFELELGGTEGDRSRWEKLLALLTAPGFRLGGRTRRGFGAFRFVACAARVFDLREHFEEYAKHPVSLAEPSPVLASMDLPESAGGKFLEVELRLRPRGYWMFGGGVDVKGEADMAPLRVSRIVWKKDKGGERGSVQKNVLLLPASSIKGALAHRTAFHYNALKGRFADGSGETDLAALCGEANPAVRALFGACKGSKDRDGENGKDKAEGNAAMSRKTRGGEPEDLGRRGRVLLDDLYLEPKAEPASLLVHHVGLDRFTGGARDQVLFSERPFWRIREEAKSSPMAQRTPEQHSLPALHIRILDPEEIEKEAPGALHAFRRALDDLVEGRLQLGAGSGRGMGYCEAARPVAWPKVLCCGREESR